MNKKLYLKTVLWASLSAAALQSCVKSDDYSVPPINCSNKFADPNHTLADLAALGKLAPAQSDIIANDFIVEGYVSSNDESGNIYKTLYVQDSPSNPTQAIEIDIDGPSIYTNFPLGSKVRINAKGLIVQSQSGNVKLGAYDPSYAVGRINPNLIQNYISRVCGKDGMGVVATMVPVEFQTFADAEKPENINKLVKVNNVQFAADATGMGATDATSNTFADPLAASGVSDRYMVDKSSNTFDFRNSTYANFAKTLMRPTYAGSGSVTFILSQYNGKSWQGYLRDLNDLQLTGQRFAVGLLGGSALTYTAPLSETFESLTATTTATNLNAPQYINYAETGGRYWQIVKYQNNNYIQMSANKATGAVHTYFIMPTTFNGNNVISFDTKDGYNNGNVLKVYYSTTYQPGSLVGPNDLKDITSNFVIASGTATGYAANYTHSGNYTLTGVNGKGFLFFEYTGSATVTTTMQIDNVKVQ